MDKRKYKEKDFFADKSRELVDFNQISLLVLILLSWIIKFLSCKKCKMTLLLVISHSPYPLFIFAERCGGWRFSSSVGTSENEQKIKGLSDSSREHDKQFELAILQRCDKWVWQNGEEKGYLLGSGSFVSLKAQCPSCVLSLASLLHIIHLQISFLHKIQWICYKM